MAAIKKSSKKNVGKEVTNIETALAIIEAPETTAVEIINETTVEDAEIIEIEKTHKSEIINDIKRRAQNLDRFKNGRSSKFNPDKYIYRKLLSFVSVEQLEALNSDLKAKLEKLI